MMIGAETYLESVKDYTFDELLLERDMLIDEIHEYERTKDEPRDVIERPSPETRYNIHHEYLAKLCDYIAQRYRKEELWMRH